MDVGQEGWERTEMEGWGRKGRILCLAVKIKLHQYKNSFYWEMCNKSHGLLLYWDIYDMFIDIFHVLYTSPAIEKRIGIRI